MGIASRHLVVALAVACLAVGSPLLAVPMVSVVTQVSDTDLNVGDSAVITIQAQVPAGTPGISDFDLSVVYEYAVLRIDSIEFPATIPPGLSQAQPLSDGQWQILGSFPDGGHGIGDLETLCSIHVTGIAAGSGSVRPGADLSSPPGLPGLPLGAAFFRFDPGDPGHPLPDDGLFLSAPLITVRQSAGPGPGQGIPEPASAVLCLLLAAPALGAFLLRRRRA
jgi:hypothetical protein